MVAPVIKEASIQDQAYQLAIANQRLAKPKDATTTDFLAVETAIPGSRPDTGALLAVSTREEQRSAFPGLFKRVSFDSKPGASHFARSIASRLAAQINELENHHTNIDRLADDRRLTGSREKAFARLRQKTPDANINLENPFALFMDVVMGSLDKLIGLKMQNAQADNPIIEQDRINTAIADMANIAIETVNRLVHEISSSQYTNFTKLIRNQIDQDGFTALHNFGDKLLSTIFGDKPAKTGLPVATAINAEDIDLLVKQGTGADA